MVYLADYAQRIYDKNKKKCGRKVYTNFEIRDRVDNFLKYKFSPEMIVKRVLKGKISVSTIYYWINKGIFELIKKRPNLS